MKCNKCGKDVTLEGIECPLCGSINELVVAPEVVVRKEGKKMRGN
jgi:hypothetical protein